MLCMLPIILLSFTAVTAYYILPHPSGKYNVTLTIGSLIDYSHNDPSASTTPRESMLSVFQPAKCESTTAIPYMPNKTAKFQESLLQDLFQAPADVSLLLEARLPVCSDNTNPLEDSPILLFSPGYTVPRLYYNLLASEIASQGFTVITIDHPEDANIITYSDGHAVYNNDTSMHPAAWKAHLPIRTTDASFVIDQLSNATAMAELLPQRGHRAFLTDRIAMMGHSLGGVASVIAAGQDSRILGAINWDGTFVVTPPEEGVHFPVLLMSREAADDASWPTVWPLLKGPKLWTSIADTTHMTFSDVPSLLQARGQDPSGVDGLLGTIAPDRMIKILVEYTVAWVDMVFRGREDDDWQCGLKHEDFPEVSIVLRENV